MSASESMRRAQNRCQKAARSSADLAAITTESIRQIGEIIGNLTEAHGGIDPSAGVVEPSDTSKHLVASGEEAGEAMKLLNGLAVAANVSLWTDAVNLCLDVSEQCDSKLIHAIGDLGMAVFALGEALEGCSSISTEADTLAMQAQEIIGD